MKDPYQVLGVAKSASDADIKKAYRALAKKYHPDLAPDDKIIADKFKEVSAAYDILGDASKRKQFDRGEIDADGNPKGFGGGAGGFGGRRKSGRAGADPFADAFGFGFDFNSGRGSTAGEEDIFADFFSQRRQERRATPQKGQDQELTIEITLEESIQGTSKPVKLLRGKTVNVKIPAGIEAGQVVRLKGQGHLGIHGGADGDALVSITVKPNSNFTRIGDNIESHTAVPLATAVLGGKVTIHTVDGPVSVTVPKQSSSGTRLRLKGKGVPKKDGTRGDHFAIVQIMLPDPPDPELERLLAQRGTSHNYTV